MNEIGRETRRGARMDVKDAIAGTVTGARERLTGLSHRLHAHPGSRGPRSALPPGSPMSSPALDSR